MKIPEHYLNNDTLQLLVSQVYGYYAADMTSYRKALGLTSQDFADICSHSRSTQHRIESDPDQELSFQYQCVLDKLLELYPEELSDIKLHKPNGAH